VADAVQPAAAPAPPSAKERGAGLLALARQEPGAVLGIVFLLGLMVASLVAPLPYSPGATDATASLQGPSAAHWFGTDNAGADVFSRVIAAARVDLSLAFAGTLLSLALGIPLGLAASTKGRGSERLVRALDAFQAFPLVILALALVTLSGNALYMVVVAIALINVPRYMRLLRSEVLGLRESRFVEAAQAMGASPLRVTTRHLLPNAWGVVLVQTSLTVGNAIVVIAALSFLGAGVSPETASWGAMIRDGSAAMSSGDWWIATFPGLVVVLCVLSLNQLADVLDRRGTRSHR
jgi:peptide/nickel transport system permease protein